VDWHEEFLRGLGLMRGNLAAPLLLDRIERSFWLDLLRSPVLDAIEEERVEVRRYGPVLATAVPRLPNSPLFNNVLGAMEPGAVEEGHLEEALEWIEPFGVDFRVPITPEREGSGAAEDLLNRRGYSRDRSLVRFLRRPTPPEFAQPPGIEVVEVKEFTEGFSEYPGQALDLDFMATSLFDCLPGRDNWRCYVAVGEERPMASASMMVHWEVAMLGLAGSMEEYRGMGAHLALLRQRIVDAGTIHCHTMCAETEETPGDPDGPSPAARNLVRAGFKQVSVRPVWGPERPDEVV
jgi:hypothetical protein